MDYASHERLIDLEVLGVRALGDEDSPVLLLHEPGESLMLPIWVGNVDAAALVLELSDTPPISRPLTHDLLASVIRAFVGDASGQVVITNMDDGLFFARVQVLDLDLDARPSDAVTLALKLGWPIRCPRQLMDQVGVEVDEVPIDEVDEFRAFLDQVSADDFSEGETP